MFAVIFRADINQLDDDYIVTATRMRELALGKYGCLDFISVSEDRTELAISYWPDLDSIQAWKSDPEHLAAQERGRSSWYGRYRVEVVEVLRQYGSEAQSDNN